MKQSLRSSAWLWLLAAYAYGVTCVSAAAFLWRARRLAGVELPFGWALAWQAGVYGLWFPLAGGLWLLVRQPRFDGRAVAGVLGLSLFAVPAHAMSATALDAGFAPGVGQRFAEQMIERLPIDMAVWTAFVGVFAALAWRMRAREASLRAEALAEALAAARTAASEASAGPAEPLRLLVSVGQRRASVDAAEVDWFGSAGNYVVVNWNGREGLIRETLSALQERLDPAVFARAHRSTIVNLARVSDAAPLSDGSWRLTLVGGMELVVSRTYRDEVLRRLGRG